MHETQGFPNHFAHHATHDLAQRHTHKTPNPRFFSCRKYLNVSVVRDRGDRLGEVGVRVDNAGFTGLDGLSLQVKVSASLLSLTLLDGVLLDTVDELLTGARVNDVLDANVDTLLEVTVADTLVDDDTDGGLGHVVDDTGLAVVQLVGQTVE
jgi:hypothetical protein